MRPLFTINAGEFVVGDFIEKMYREKKYRLNVWHPSKDTGVDLLVTDGKNQKTISLQVKLSHNFLATDMHANHRKKLRAMSWFSLDRQKIDNSKADYWVFVLVDFTGGSRDFVIIEPSQLLARLDKIHNTWKITPSYLWVTKDNHCWETRGLKRREQDAIDHGQYANKDRDFTEYLNDWAPVRELNTR